MTKMEIRKAVLQLRDNLPLEKRQKSEKIITEYILNSSMFLESKYILCFASYGSEISTLDIWKHAVQIGKKVFMPKVIKDSEHEYMSFFRVEEETDLIPGYKGIKEPSVDCEKFCLKDTNPQNVMMIMPGVAFDKENRRIGYGKGFYDRYISENKELIKRTIAIGFSCQLIDNIPADSNDINPYLVVCR